MNDRFLFRAKRVDSGEWVEGNLITDEHNPNICFVGYLFAMDESGNVHDTDIAKVDPSTICQCTGIKDKNGKLIWEGDICIIRDGTLDEEDGYFRLDWEIDRAMFEFEGPGLCVNFDNVYGYECEVVGNIFDNPELLEWEE